MAQGEFALVRKHLETAIHKKSVHLARPDLYAMLVDVAVLQRDEAALREYAPVLEEEATEIDHLLYRAVAHRGWGVLHRQEGQYTLAEERLEQAMALFRKLDTRWQLGRTLVELGELATVQSQPDVAQGHFARALALFEEIGARPDVDRTRAKMGDKAN